MNQLEQIKAIEKGKGIQYLLDAAYKIFGNPIVMFDTYYNLKAYTDVVTDDPIWNEIISTGTFSAEKQEFFLEERITEDVANSDKLVVLKSEKLKYDRILANIFNRENIKVANIVMVECSGPFASDTQTAFEALADIITDEIKNDDYFTAFGRAFHESMIKMILDRRIENTGIYTAHLQILYDGFEDYLYLAVVDLFQNVKSPDRLVHFRDLLKNRYPSFKFAVYSDYVLMVISSKHCDFFQEGILGEHEETFIQNSLYAGISSSFENICDLYKYFEEAVTVLKNGIAGGSGRHVFICDNNQRR